MITTTLYRYWREAHGLGLSIEPASNYRDEAGQLADHAYAVTGPDGTTELQIIADLESWLATWLADVYADPAARARAAEHGMRMALDRTAT